VTDTQPPHDPKAALMQHNPLNLDIVKGGVCVCVSQCVCVYESSHALPRVLLTLLLGVVCTLDIYKLGSALL